MKLCVPSIQLVYVLVSDSGVPNVCEARSVAVALRVHCVLALKRREGFGRLLTFTMLDCDINSLCFLAEIDHIKVFVLDEADEMLSRGFKDQIHEVFQHLPQDVQVILLSATMPQDVLEVSKQFMRNPVSILVKKEELTLEGKLITFLMFNVGIFRSMRDAVV